MKREYYKIAEKTQTYFNDAETYEGEPLEYKIRRITTQNEPITDSAPLEYDDAETDEIDPNANIRTDKWNIAENAMEMYEMDKEERLKALQNLPETNEENNDQNEG